MLDLRDVDVYYGSSHVLHRTTLHVAEGETYALLGRNGMGKTTLVHTVMGFLRPRGGVITLAGERISGLASERIARRGVALVPQGRRVFPSLTVGETLEVSYRDGGREGWTLTEVCDRFPILGDRWGQTAGLLSGGQQQMLAIARALVTNSAVVLLDEPTEGLDPSRVTAVADVVAELARRGTTTLLVEQKVRFAVDLADRIGVLSRGEVVHSVAGGSMRKDPAPLYAELGFT